MADERSWVSPYSYCQNNPVMRVDPTGALDGWYKDENGTTTYDANINSQADLKTAGIQGTYVGQAFSGTMSNGCKVSGDAKGNLSMSLPEVSIHANKNSTSYLYSNVFGLALSMGGFYAESVSSFSKNVFKTLQAKSNTLKLGLDYGAELGKVGKLGNIARWTGVFGGALSIGTSGYEFSQSQTLKGKVEHGFDAFMGAVGFAGPVGAGVSIYWGTVGKPLHNKWRKDVLMPQIEMGIEGYPSSMPFK